MENNNNKNNNTKAPAFQLPKGTHDVMPDEVYKWQYVESVVREVSHNFCCLEIRTPMFEHTEVFLRNIGEETDIVSKEMYTFFDKGERSLTLKPEGTAAVARSFVQNGLYGLGMPQRMYYITPVFRYENPQKGRYRQHHQFGVEFFGSSSPYMDFEVIHLAHQVLSRLGLKGIKLNLNSIGCPACRPQYVEALKAFASQNVDKLCGQCRTRLNTNPLRILDCKVDTCKQVLKYAPLISEHVCDECKTHQNTLVDMLKYAGIECVINPFIVRGLDYYTRTVFEFVATSDTLGNQSTVCGGGRYDNLIKNMGGSDVNCVGFGMGIERLIAIMTEQNLDFGKPNTPQLTIAYASPDQLEYCMQLATKLRPHISVDIDYNGKSLKSQFKRADKCKSAYAITIGETEQKSGVAVLRNLSNRDEREINLEIFLKSPLEYM